MCNRCWTILMEAGSVGKKRKGTNERWWLVTTSRRSLDSVRRRISIWSRAVKARSPREWQSEGKGAALHSDNGSVVGV